nr:hypothetical protein [uncultured Methanoregula sp.]
MARASPVLLLLLICVLLLVPVQAASEDSASGFVSRSFNYVLDGRPGTLSLGMSTELYNGYLGMKPSRDPRDNASYFLAYMNEPLQKPYVAEMAGEVREVTPNPDDQARVAASLVQHITYEKGEKYRYPYEVLYEGGGVCGEKSMLMASLFGDLGFKSAVLYFVPENHMTAGIACPPPYDFRNTGYCMIEANHVYVITDETTFESAGQVGWSEPEVIPVSGGRSLESVQSDFNDAREWIALKTKIRETREAGTTLSSDEYQRWSQLKSKYDLY